MTVITELDVTNDGGRNEPAYAKIYSILHAHLNAKELSAGLVLGQASVARAFNVSRVPAGIALKRLHDEGLIDTFEGRGYIVPGGSALRIDLEHGGLNVPQDAAQPATSRREKIYPEVEHSITVCLAYGRFQLNETALAQHYDVSRTVAHEVLTQLERAGIIEQDSNNRWYAGPLSASEFEHHYEMRWLLEPQALRHAFPHLDMTEVRQRLEKIEKARREDILPALLEGFETDLHIDTLQPCTNTILLTALRRSQRMLIATHSTFVEYRHAKDIDLMASEHIDIYRALLERDLDHATVVLEKHLSRSVKVNLGMLERLAPLPDIARPPYLIQVR